MDSIQTALQFAHEARNRAYAPYSKFQVGACLKVKGQDLYFSGCNVENASYGATVCAERTAIHNAISQNGLIPFEFLLLLTDTNPVATPCGICRQTLAEFCPPEFPIHLANLSGVQKTLTLSELLPHQFEKDHLSCK